jgi:large subunit ribosomal protein L4
VIVDDLVFKNAKTKNALDTIKALNLKGKILLVGETSNEFVALAVRNLTKVSYVTRNQLSAIDLIKADFVVLAQPTITKIEEALQ